ncbi:MAG: NAD(P)H-quinone oxidoreductase [Cystobacterineae bacterium]|nr:NAD(P)H-quinone oxidoreductase [Cystobacterineae bacterium]
MKAICMTDTSGPQGLQLLERDMPKLGPEDILVKVKASAINRADLLQTRGLYPAPFGVPADIPGLEFAGKVLRVGEKTQRFKPEDRVMGLVGGGAWAEYVTLHEGELLPLPQHLSYAQAAAIPEAFMTAFDAMVLQGGLGRFGRVLIHAVGSGVGSAGLQLAKAMDCSVAGTSRTADKLEQAKALGLDVGVLVSEKPAKFAAALKTAWPGGAQVVLELVGGHYVPESIAAMAPGGRLLLVGLLAGVACELPLGAVLNKRVQLIGTTLRSRALADKILLARAFSAAVLPLFEKQILHPVVAKTYPFSEVAQALADMSKNDFFGKVVLEW